MNFQNLSSAYRRAQHFCVKNGLEFDGAFTALNNVAARNYCMLLDAGDDALDDLVLMDSWARSINRHIDTHKVDGDEDMQIALASFLSRSWCDPTRLRA